jgi:hypothetical protein
MNDLRLQIILSLDTHIQTTVMGLGVAFGKKK